ncbi:MAG: LCP family protein [Bacillota bacterium]
MMPSRKLRQARRKRIERLVIIGLALIMLIAVVYSWSSLMGYRTAPLAGIFSPGGRVNILILGVDERPDDVGRSDTMFLLTINPKTQDVAMLSIPRDTRVSIPGYGYDKINHAYGEGKYKLSLQTAEKLLGVNINYWVTVDFNGLKRIIDALGGVTIDVEKRMYYEDPWDNLVIDLRPGVQKLRGADAIGYVRYRDEDGDIGRIERQQKFIKAVMQQVTQPSTIANLPTLIKELYGAIHTNMSLSDMISYAKIFNNAREKGLRSYMVPGTPAYINDVSYWLPDMVALKKMMAGIMGTNFDDRAMAAAQQQASEYQQYIPKEMVIPKQEDKPKELAKNKDGAAAKTPPQPTERKPAGQTAPAKIRAEVINASGDSDAAAQMVRELQRQGIEVVSTSAARTPARVTTVIDHTGNATVQKKLNNLPFDYNLSILGDGAKGAEITVIIGRNYN